jgi:hypothetical protein
MIGSFAACSSAARSISGHGQGLCYKNMIRMARLCGGQTGAGADLPYARHFDTGYNSKSRQEKQNSTTCGHCLKTAPLIRQTR